ncbi:excinuclease ABC subunit UvrA [candidate division WWE3 bacterium]|jgi:excinuclease ABC subunit A|nr:excinuclease ABC subunit UvrA [candidate division WWE3 bacterium]MBT7349423.1 excinuclease ABC subunit UvrA [candidate division WWE3 bacterium]
MPNPSETITVRGAREHNLKDVNLEIPKNKFVVFTGVSGSGKSSLAMDTIYAEGQRRYVESLSAYARQFLGVMDKPDVDSIEGLSPAIAIDQKTTSRNPRSTVGTVTEVYDFLRLLYARAGHPHCPDCGREITRQSSQQIVDSILKVVSSAPEYKTARGVRLLIMSPIIRDRKGEYSSLFKNLQKQGIVRARVDGHIRDLSDHLELIKTNKHTIEALLHRLIITSKKLKDPDEEKALHSSLHQSVETALKLSNGYVAVSIVKDKDFDFVSDPKEFEDHMFSENFACAECGISLPDFEPRMFSFNSPHGACSVCDGLGTQLNIDEDLMINPNLSVREGGIFPWAKLFESHTWTAKVVESVAQEYGFSLSIPIGELSKKYSDILFYGPTKTQKFQVSYEKDGNTHTYYARFEGVIPNLIRRHRETKSDYIRREIEKYMIKEDCPKCKGARLNDSSLSVVVDGKSIFDITNMSIDVVAEWASSLEMKLSEREQIIAEPIMKEIMYRLNFLIDVGLSYLTLSRAGGDLSGGEAQRIRLASQIGSGLSGVLYVLDEPSIGLHQRDQGRLINTLKNLRDLGNTVIVVEHDTETMNECDHIVDFGPGAGAHGGEVVSSGTPAQVKKDKNSLTGKYLSGKRSVGKEVRKHLKKLEEEPKQIYNGEYLRLRGATGRNLKNIDFEIPLGKFVCVTGVSGSGKSSLVMDTLHTALRQDFGLKIYERAEPFKDLTGTENIDKIIAIDQAPIGRTPKSNPATYTKTFDHIRELYSKTEGSRIRGYRPGRFSFNVKGGRCESCAGEGQIKIEMQFMPDVYVNCEVCEGKRYNRETLEVDYKGKNISEVLDMTVEEGLSFFDNIPPIKRKIQTLYDVGLGYIKLGQPAPTLSGGEAQRVKLSTELAKKTRGKVLYILDEPTTGLHFADLERLITIIKRLTAKGNTVLVIEHNMDVIANSDWVVDLGPEGGEAGGQVMFSGPLDELPNHKQSHTAEALRQQLELMK